MAAQQTARQHGTRTKYVHDGCRCLLCRVANTDYQTGREDKRRERNPWRTHYLQEIDSWIVRNQLTCEIDFRSTVRGEAYDRRDELNRQEEEALGQAPLWADERLWRRVRRHIRGLQKSGMGINHIARTTSLSRNRLMEIADGRGHRANRPDKPRLRCETARRILAVTAKPAPRALIPATETWRILDELLFVGFSRAWIAKALGRKTPALQINRRRVTQKTEDEVRFLHNAAFLRSARLCRYCQCPGVEPWRSEDDARPAHLLKPRPRRDPLWDVVNPKSIAIAGEEDQ